MTFHVLLTVRPIDGLENISTSLYQLPEIIFKVSARLLEISGDHDDPRILKFLHEFAVRFGLHLYLYDPFGLHQDVEIDFIPTVYSYNNLFYYLGGSSTPSLTEFNEPVGYGRVLNMKNGFSQQLSVDGYNFIRYYNADGRSTTTVMDLDMLLTNSSLYTMFATRFGLPLFNHPVVNFKSISVLPTPQKDMTNV